jgi:hypothetical protein
VATRPTNFNHIVKKLRGTCASLENGAVPFSAVLPLCPLLGELILLVLRSTPGTDESEDRNPISVHDFNGACQSHNSAALETSLSLQVYRGGTSRPVDPKAPRLPSIRTQHLISFVGWNQ